MTHDGNTDALSDPTLVACGLDALDDVFYVYDADRRLVYWNDRLNEVFAATDEDLAGSTPASFFLPEDRERVEAAVSEVLETGETTVEARADTPEGVVRFQLTGRRLRDGDEVVGFSGIGRDVTERREQEVQLALQNERLEEFANLVSHDLRNPLQVATGLLELELLEREGDDGEREDGGRDGSDDRDDDRLERVADALDRMGRIVEDVLAIARGGIDIEDPRPVSLAALARETWETVDTGDATLAVDTQTVVEGDPVRLDRLFANLFRNAIEHGSGGREDADTGDDTADLPTVGAPLAVRVVDTNAGFAVEDDGVGVPAADRDHVFDSGFSSKRDGTGFGLDIVDRIAGAHGWTVVVERGATGGARFAFDIGLDRAASE